MKLGLLVGSVVLGGAGLAGCGADAGAQRKGATSTSGSSSGSIGEGGEASSHDADESRRPACHSQDFSRWNCSVHRTLERGDACNILETQPCTCQEFYCGEGLRCSVDEDPFASPSAGVCVETCAETTDCDEGERCVAQVCRMACDPLAPCVPGSACGWVDGQFVEVPDHGCPGGGWPEAGDACEDLPWPPGDTEDFAPELVQGNCAAGTLCRFDEGGDGTCVVLCSVVEPTCGLNEQCVALEDGAELGTCQSGA